MLEGVWDVKWEVSFGAGCIRLLFFFSGHSGPFRSQTWPLPGECQWAHGWYLSGTRVLGRGGCQPIQAMLDSGDSHPRRDVNQMLNSAASQLRSDVRWCSFVGWTGRTSTLLKTRTAAPVRLLPLPAEDGHILSDSLSRMSCYVTLFASVCQFELCTGCQLNLCPSSLDRFFQDEWNRSRSAAVR